MALGFVFQGRAPREMPTKKTGMSEGLEVAVPPLLVSLICGLVVPEEILKTQNLLSENQTDL